MPTVQKLARGESSARAVLDLPTPGKGKSGDHEKKSRDSTKNCEILYFPRSNTFTIEGTGHQSHSQRLLPFQSGEQTRRKTLSYLTQAKITAQYQKKL